MAEIGSPPIWRRSTRCGEANCVEIATADDAILIRDSKLDNSPVLGFSREAWSDFVAGIRAGEFN